MSLDSKKAAPDGRNIQDGEWENILPDSKNSPALNSITPGESGQAPIWSLLNTGAANALSRSYLAGRLGISERDIRRLVHQERAAGFPICSGTDAPGYFRPVCREDVARFCRSMWHRAAQTREVADALQRTLDEIDGQSRLEGFDAE